MGECESSIQLYTACAKNVSPKLLSVNIILNYLYIKKYKPFFSYIYNISF